MSRALRNAAAFKRAQANWDNAAPPEPEEEGDEVDPAEAERDAADMHAERLYWQGQER